MTERQLPKKAVGLIAVVIFCGAVALGLAVTSWETADLAKFVGLLTLGLFAAGTKLSIPTRAGNLPLTFIFVLLGALELSGPETVILAVITALCQWLWNPPDGHQVMPFAYHVAAMVLSASATVAIYHSSIGAGASSPHVIRYCVATAVFGLMQTVSLAAAVAISDEISFFSTWRNCFFWSMPHYIGGAFTALAFSVVSSVVGWQTLVLSAPLIYLVLRAYRLHVSRLENQRKHAEDVSALHLRTIQALALAIEAKDQTTHSHLARVQVYAREIGRDLKLTEAEQEALLAASMLHDIGKLAVPEHIISKPGRLSPEEFEKMKIHPIVGAEILEQVQFPYPVVPIVRAHHERWDGAGYPAGLKGEEIPIGARILAAVDCLDALASDRQYRRALPLDEAMKVVEKDSGRAFDPQVVEVLKRRYVELEQMAKNEATVAGASLSTDVKVDRGDAPAAGFEAHADAPAARNHLDYVTMVAAARQELQGLLDFSRALGDTLSVDDTMSMLGVRLRKLVPHHSMTVWVRKENVLAPVFVVGDDFRLFSSLEIPMGQGLSGWVAENAMPIVNGNPSVESGYLADSKRYSSLRSAIAVPLEGVDGVSGVLALYHADRDAFSKEHLRLLQAVSAKVAVALENATPLRAAEQVAAADAVPGVADARELLVQLERELSRARRQNIPVTVAVMNVEGFKEVHARFGRLEANEALRAFTLGLRSACRDYDVVARTGADEFAVLLPGARPEDVGSRMAQFHNMLAGVCGGRFSRDLALTAGTASYPWDGENAEALLSQADRRMYADKRRYHAPKPIASKPAAATAEIFIPQTIH
jgi:diguanylate cyclase (GGDEF)-like protein/putative nucleotidyltransferase with HDIG domain